MTLVDRETRKVVVSGPYIVSFLVVRSGDGLNLLIEYDFACI
jgi:hypothetical protein